MKRAAGAVHAELAQRDAAMLRDGVPPIGRLTHITLGPCEGRPTSVVLDLRKAGPAIGRMASGEIVVLEPWRGLPSIPTGTPTPCKACTAPCDECAGTGKRGCVYPGCGGRGRVIVVNAVMDGDKVVSPEQATECPECKGTKMQACALCAGTGKMSTGFKDGALYRYGRQNITCPECRGQRTIANLQPQPIEPHVGGMLEGMVMVGPVVGLTHAALTQGDKPAGQITVVNDLEDRPMVLLIENNRAWFYGGIARAS